MPIEPGKIGLRHPLPLSAREPWRGFQDGGAAATVDPHMWVALVHILPVARLFPVAARPCFAYQSPIPNIHTACHPFFRPLCPGQRQSCCPPSACTISPRITRPTLSTIWECRRLLSVARYRVTPSTASEGACVVNCRSLTQPSPNTGIVSAFQRRKRSSLKSPIFTILRPWISFEEEKVRAGATALSATCSTCRSAR